MAVTHSRGTARSGEKHTTAKGSNLAASDMIPSERGVHELEACNSTWTGSDGGVPVVDISEQNRANAGAAAGSNDGRSRPQRKDSRGRPDYANRCRVPAEWERAR